MKTPQEWADHHLETYIGYDVPLLEWIHDVQQDAIDSVPSGIHSCNNECQRPNCVLRRQHAAYKQALEKIVGESGLESADESFIWAIRHIAKHALNTK